MMEFYVPNHDGIFCFLEQKSFIFNRQIVLIKIYLKKMTSVDVTEQRKLIRTAMLGVTMHDNAINFSKVICAFVP